MICYDCAWFPNTRAAAMPLRISMQFIQGKLADMYTSTQASRALVAKVAMDADQGR